MVQCAGTIVIAINRTLSKQQSEANPVMGLLAQIIAAGQGELEPGETGSKKKK